MQTDTGAEAIVIFVLNRPGNREEKRFTKTGKFAIANRVSASAIAIDVVELIHVYRIP